MITLLRHRRKSFRAAAASDSPAYVVDNEVYGTNTVSVTLSSAVTDGVAVMFVYYSTGSGTGAQTATFDSTSMTEIASAGAGRDAKTFILPIGNKGAGTYDAVFDWSNTTIFVSIAIYENVYQTTPNETALTSTGYTSSLSVSPTSDVGDLTICHGFQQVDANTLTPNGSQTEYSTRSNVTLSWVDSSSGTTSVGWTSDGTTNSTVHGFTLNAVADDYRSTVLADNPLFYYRLGEASGTTAYNEVTASSDGTYYNTPTLGQTGAVSGDSDTTVLFEQANSEYAETVTLTSETSLLPCTIECFIKTSGASDSYAGIVFYRSGSNSASGLNIRGTDLGKLGYHWRGQSNTFGYAGAPTLSDNTWYYVALVVTSTEATFYVIEEDGTLTTAVNNVSHSALDCSNDGWHIALDSGYTRYFQGYIDEVALYDQALSQSTLVAHAAAAGFTPDITLEASATKTSATYSSPTNIDVNIPAVSANDILLLFVTTNDESAPTDSPPSGWTKITEKDGGATSRSTVAAYWKRASSSASATTETWSSFFPNGENYYIWVGAYSGCVTSGSPVDAFGSSAAGYASVWSVDVTTTTADTMIVTISGTTSEYATHTWSDGTELIDTAYPSSATAAVSINEKLEATAGSKTRTVTSSSTTSNAMIAVALRPK